MRARLRPTRTTSPWRSPRPSVSGAPRMDNASAAGATPPSAPVYPVFAAVAVGMTGRTVYQVIDAVGGIFEAAGAVFEGSPDAPGALIALLPPSDHAAVDAVELGLQAQSIERALRIGVDAVEVHSKKEQDTRWQQVIDSAVTPQKAARTGEAIAADAIGSLTHGAAATTALHVGDDTYLLLTGVGAVDDVPAQASTRAEPSTGAEPSAVVSFAEPVATDIATTGTPTTEQPAEPEHVAVDARPTAEPAGLAGAAGAADPDVAPPFAAPTPAGAVAGVVAPPSETAAAGPANEPRVPTATEASPASGASIEPAAPAPPARGDAGPVS